MRKALFISSQEDLHRLATLLLNQSTEQIYLLPARSVSESLKLIEKHKNFDLIYLGHRVKKDRELKDLSGELMRMIKEHKTLLVGTNKSLRGKEWAHYFPQMASLFSIVSETLKLLDFDLATGSFVEVPVLSLLEYEVYPADCYNVQSQKLLSAGEPVDMAKIYEIKEAGKDYLYLSHDQVKAAIADMVETADVLDAEEIKNPKKVFKEASDYAAHLLKESQFPLNKEHLEIANNAQQEMQNVISVSRGSKKVLKALIEKEQKFYYKHVAMTSLVSCFILDELLLTDPAMKNKLCLAAQFQNIYLQNDAELKVDSDDQLERFEAGAKKRIINHPLMAFDILSKNKTFDADVLKVIKEQHGEKRGIGFPEKIQSTLKISLIFQVSSLFSQLFLIEKEKGLKPIPMDIFNRIYSRLMVKDQSILKALRAVILEL